MTLIACIDFETMPIDGNPLLKPPVPIGVAIKLGKDPSYYVTDKEDMLFELEQLWASDVPLLFHNAPFDLSVARTHLGLAWPSWERIHDTSLRAYLVNPHSRSLSLKELVVQYKAFKPDGRDELRQWILDNVGMARDSNWGRFICIAQEDEEGAKLVAQYACEDTDMTYALNEKLKSRHNAVPYALDRELAPYLIESTIKGIRVDRERLALDAADVRNAIVKCEKAIRSMLGVPCDFKINSPKQLADALDAKKWVSKWERTEKGARSIARESLVKCVTNKKLLELLVYRGAMQTCHGTFMKGWLKRSVEDGRLHPNWNQYKTTHGKSNKGTRTGRLSSDDPRLNWGL